MQNGRKNIIIDILLVEDNPGDVRLIEELLKECNVRTNVIAVNDGIEAMDYLRQHMDSLPHFILLDLNLPRKNGMEVLEEIKNDKELKSIPVIILTTSGADEDIARCYQLNSNAFLTKPADLNEFIRLIKIIEDFWLTAVQLPVRKI